MIGEVWREHLRIAILKAIHAAPGYALNDSVVRDLVKALGFPAGRDQVRVELAWLAEQGLATCTEVGSLVVAALTARGEDAATGAVTVPGVRRPSARG